MRTNTKIVKELIKKHILEYTTVEELKANIKSVNYDYNTNYNNIIRLVEGGLFLIYNDDISEFLTSLNINEKSKKFNENDSFNLYKHLIALNGEKLFEKNGGEK